MAAELRRDPGGRGEKQRRAEPACQSAGVTAIVRFDQS